jgi:murein DD-endopeptidase MepM/ murein hydrolase activator NlpD
MKFISASLTASLVVALIPMGIGHAGEFTIDSNNINQLGANKSQYFEFSQPDSQFSHYIWPTQGTVTSGYGVRWGKMHKGIDIAAPIGTPIVAAASGVVTKAGWNNGGYGNLVEIQHPDGSLTRYAHNSRLLVRVGQSVEQGQLIAQMGSTGHSTGSHCHFEVHPTGQAAVNPVAYLPTDHPHSASFNSFRQSTVLSSVKPSALDLNN